MSIHIAERSKWIPMHIDTAGKRPAVMFTIRIERMKIPTYFCSEEIIRGPLFENEKTNDRNDEKMAERESSGGSTESMTRWYQLSVDKIAQFRPGAFYYLWKHL